MASAPSTTDDLVDQFLTTRGHDVPETWERVSLKKQCPECYGLHERTAAECTVCGWQPS